IIFAAKVVPLQRAGCFPYRKYGHEVTAQQPCDRGGFVSLFRRSGILRIEKPRENTAILNCRGRRDGRGVPVYYVNKSSASRGVQAVTQVSWRDEAESPVKVWIFDTGCGTIEHLDGRQLDSATVRLSYRGGGPLHAAQRRQARSD